MGNVIDAAFEDTEPAAPKDKLEELVSLINRLDECNEEVIRQEEILKQAKALVTELEQKMIPDFMHELGIEELKLPDGRKVSLANFYSHITPSRMTNEHFSWLDTHGHGSIIKDEMIIDMGKEATEFDVKEIQDLARQQGWNVKRKRGVHNMTLKSFIKEDVESGNLEVPHKLFDVFVGNTTKVKSS